MTSLTLITFLPTEINLKMPSLPFLFCIFFISILLLQLLNHLFLIIDPLPQRGVGRMAAETPETSVPLHKEIPVKTGFDIEQPLRVGERQESQEVQARPTRI